MIGGRSKMMQIEVYDDYAGLSRRAAEMVAELVREKPNAVLGLPTGSTPEGFYTELVGLGLSLAQVRVFNLDEYLGLPKDHPESYYSYMKTHLYDRTDIRPEHCQIPDGMTADPAAECQRYEAAIQAAGGLDLIILGVGHNGHIGFNEPGTPWDSHTRRVALAERTREANARFFNSMAEVPTHALTMGIGTILEARRILLLASGPDKASIIRETVMGEPRIEVPATALQSHPAVAVLLDTAASRKIER